MADQPSHEFDKNRLNIDTNLAAALCYLFGCISGIVLYLIETENKKIRFHAVQSFLIFTVLAIIAIFTAFMAIFNRFFIFQLVNSIIWIAQFVVWILMVIKTYQGETLVLPVVGEFARQNVGWP